MRDEKMLQEVYALAKIYAPKVCIKMNSNYSAEDLVQDFIVNFMEKDFGAKFDAKTTSLNHYVWLGLRNILVSKFRHESAAVYNKVTKEDEAGNVIEVIEKLPANVSSESMVVSTGDTLSLFDLIEDNRPVDKMFSDLLKEEIIAMIAEVPFGYDVEVAYDGKLYPSNVRSIVALFLEGFTVTELSEKFQVTAARIGQLLREAILALPAEIVY